MAEMDEDRPPHIGVIDVLWICWISSLCDLSVVFESSLDEQCWRRWICKFSWHTYMSIQDVHGDNATPTLLYHVLGESVVSLVLIAQNGSQAGCTVQEVVLLEKNWARKCLQYNYDMSNVATSDGPDTIMFIQATIVNPPTRPQNLSIPDIPLMVQFYSQLDPPTQLHPSIVIALASTNYVILSKTVYEYLDGSV
jgi:hypothetical protein